MLLNLQYLRLLAALMVVLNHAMSLVLRIGRDDIGNSFEMGAAGVDIFFAISGFIMVYITSGRRMSVGAFLRDRLIRIVPPYWAVTAVAALLIAFIPHIFDSIPLTWGHLLASLFFVPWSPTDFAQSVPLYLPGWTLNDEVMFYGIFAVALLTGRARIAVTAGILMALVLVGVVAPSANMVAAFYTHPILIEFIFGMLIGHLVVCDIIPGVAVSAALCTGGAILLVLAPVIWPIWRLAPERFLVWGVPSAMIVAGGVFLERRGVTRRNETLLLLGNASYAIYLTHYFVVGAIGKMWGLLHLSYWLSDVVLFTTCLAVSAAVGAAFHLGFERPVLRWLRGGTARLSVPHLPSD